MVVLNDPPLGIGLEIHKTLRNTDAVFAGKPYMGATAWPDIPEGVYKSWRRYGKHTHYRCVLYSPVNHGTPNQLVRQNIYGQAVQAYRNLTSSQKAVYNKRAQTLPMSGYNIFMREYLKSH